MSAETYEDEWAFECRFREFQRMVYDNACDHGWHEQSATWDVTPWHLLNAEGTALGLIHAEVSEALEAVRHGNPPSEHIPEFSGVEEELADVVIRCMDWAQHKGYDLFGAIISKHSFNKTRPYKHGNKLI